MLPYFALLSVAQSGESASEATSEKPAAAADDKKDTEAKSDNAEAPAFGPVDPTQVTGTPPIYPLKTDNMKEIYDGYDEQDDQMNIEPRAKADIFNALFASSQEYLVRALNSKITYKDMMLHAEDYRGEVVNIAGVLRQIEKMDCDETKYRVKNYWKGYISSGAKEIKTFIALEPPGPDIKNGVALSITGIFMKRYAYLNNEPGDKLTITPLVIARKVERSKAFEQPATVWMNSPIGIGIFCFVGVVFAVYFYTRTTTKARYANRFTHMKEERKGPQGNFPRPG